MRFSILGPLEVLDDANDPVELGGRQPRTMLAALIVHAGRSVPVDTIIDAVWGADPPASAGGTLQSYVSRLRRRLGADTLVWDDSGYRLDVTDESVDHLRFEQLADDGRRALDGGDAARARDLLVDALARWRGPALADLADLDFATGLATRLEQRRLTTLEDRLDADLALGRHAAVVGELHELVAAEPLRERLQAQLALALYRSGRQADALRTLADAGRTLREELGIEPSRELRDLEAAILAHDPALDVVTPPPPAISQPTASPASAPGPSASGATAGGHPGAARAPLIGRSTELAQLVDALDACAGDSRFVVVEGEPGIGKTRLVDELREVAQGRGALALWGRSDEGGAAPALWPWLAPLRELAARSSSVSPALEELLLGDAPMLAGQARAAQFERFEAVAQLLASAADESGAKAVVVMLDDLQWADATSLELLGFLAGRLEQGVLVVGTVRQLEVGRNDAVTDALATIARRPGSRRIVLRGLTASSTAEVLESVTKRSVAVAVSETIHTRAEGNPFYAIELVRLLDEEGSNAGDVPGSVGDVIRRRLARLPADTVDVLEVSAVVGRDVELELLARAADLPLDAVVDALDPALAHRLLLEVPDRPGALRFSHALVREVLLEDLTALRRARLHLKVADAIEARGAGVDDSEILAEHLYRAAPVGVSWRAADALEQAAEIALRRVSYAAAEQHLVKAVKLRRATATTDEQLAAELDTIFRLIEVDRALRYSEGAAELDMFDRAKDLAQRVGRRDRLHVILWLEWSSLATACRRAEADPLAREFAQFTADDPDPTVRASGHEVLAVLHWGAGDINAAVPEIDRARALLAGLPMPADGFRAEQHMITEVFWLAIHALHGDVPIAEILSVYDDLVAHSPDPFARASICGFAATCALSVGRWEDVERYALIGLEADPRSEFEFWAGQVQMQLGISQAWRGAGDEAAASFTAGLARYSGVHGRSAVASFAAVLAINLARHGHVAAAREWIDRAQEALDTYAELWNEPIVLLGQAIVAHAEGDLAASTELFDRARASAAHNGELGVASWIDREIATLEPSPST
jgi:DNA-binding SARP family transcriptional activator/tetratricopeptide (TPR) repeat protein